MGNQLEFTPSQMALVRRTVAKDANDTEYNLFMELCKSRGLNPLVRHCFCFVFHKDDPARRQMVVVVSREGQRSIAERTGAYRPDERAPRFETGEKDEHTNPAGLVSAEVSVFKHSHGEWFPVTEVAYYEEYAPIIESAEGGFDYVETGEVWADSGKPKKKKVPRGETIMMLDPAKGNWRKMPRIMLAKCAEMAALRKAFPDNFGGLYGEGEIDKGEVLDLSPSEWAEKAEQEDRISRIGGPNMLIIDWIDGKPLAAVQADQFFGLAMDFIKSCEGQPNTVQTFRDRNQASLRQYWGIKPAEAHELKQNLEKASELPAEMPQEKAYAAG